MTNFYSNNFFGHIPTTFLLMIAAIFCLPFVFVCISGVLGLAISRWSKEIILIVLLNIGYITPHLFILAEDRFHLAIVPFLAIFTAYLWTYSKVALKERWRTRFGSPSILAAFILTVLLCLNWGLELWRDAGKLVLCLPQMGI